MGAVTAGGPVIGILASDRGPGEAERANLMSETGRLFARRGARLVCLAENGVLPMPLISAARTAGGSVELLADADIALPPALAGIAMSVVPERAARLAQLASSVEVLVGLPGSLASASALFGAWAAGQRLPVVMLNRHRAYEAVKGFAADVLFHSVRNYDRQIQFADSVEDLWNKVSWVLQQR